MNEVGKALAVMAVLYGRSDLNEDAVRMLLADLSTYPSDAILEALGKCRKELRSFPTVADIISRIDDGRPGPEEAWALIPKDENESTVWTEEMAEAWGIVYRLHDEDPIAARVSFKEVYTRIVKDARARRSSVKWTPSLGLDKATHERALKAAAVKGLIGMDEAAALLPGPRYESSGQDGLQGLDLFIQTVLSNANRQQIAHYRAEKLGPEDLAAIEKKRELILSQLKVLEGKNET